MKYTVRLIWDNEASIWYTESDDLPVFLNDYSYDNLIERVRIAAPEVVEESFGYIGPVDLIFESVRVEKAKVS
ncbi:MAG: DUF1902 domain-containing protein [Oscillospiraceae bacterium]|nr:DUF1902 domain-containing protein [Oscillospiraceae bacterium]MCL2151556.1 DUF1902 domain-containing protein [Oscillospiraceae bacterium]